MFSLFLKTYNLIPEEIKEKDYTDTIYIASINDDVSNYALKLARMVRDEDFPCIIDYRFQNLKNQLEKANELISSTLIFKSKNLHCMNRLPDTYVLVIPSLLHTQK